MLLQCNKVTNIYFAVLVEIGNTLGFFGCILNSYENLSECCKFVSIDNTAAVKITRCTVMYIRTDLSVCSNGIALTAPECEEYFIRSNVAV